MRGRRDPPVLRAVGGRGVSSIQFQLLMIAMDDARCLLVSGDLEGAADLRGSAERDYLTYTFERIEQERNPQMELAL